MNLYMTKGEFRNWYMSTYISAVRFLNRTPSIRYGLSVTNNYFMVNTNTGKTAIAKLHPKDKFIYELGVAVAYSKYVGKPIPKIVETVSPSDIKIGDVVVFSDYEYTYCGHMDGQYRFAEVGTDKIVKSVQSYTGITFRKLV